jgi:hypothetical protein
MAHALHGLSLAAALCLSAPAGLRAIDLRVNQDQIYRAIAIGRSAAADRARFHGRYLAPVEDATIERLDVLTAFRRIVIETERRVQQGDHMFGARQGADLIKPWRTKLTVVLRLRFHPQNVFVSVPPYEIALGSPDVDTLDVRRTPIWARPASNQKPGAAVALIGAIVETDFDATEVGQTKRVVSVSLDGRELARTTIDFARLD